MAATWNEEDVRDIAKLIGREISSVDAYQILKNIFNANSRIIKNLIVEEIKVYFCE